MLQDPLFWVFISFVIFVALTFTPIKRFILTHLDKRAETIHAELSRAQKLREDAQLIVADYLARKEEAIRDAKMIRRRADEDAKRLHKTAQEETQELITHRQQQADAHITQTQRDSAAEIKEMIVTMAMESSYGLLAERLAKMDTADAGDPLVDQTIADLPKYLK